MCLIVLAIDVSEEFPLIFLSNRDEFYQRPTENMHWWDDQDILAGKDLQAGGTWLAINSKKQIAAVTNYRDPHHFKNDAPTRGNIPVDILHSNFENFEDYVKIHQDIWSEMNGFNLLYHDGKSTYYYSNISKQIEILKPGIHAISNAFLNTPWPKVIHSKEILRKLIDNKRFEDDELLSLLKNSEKYSEESLPETGVGIEMEKVLSAIHIQSPIYGTRTHTIITKNNHGVLNISEHQVLSENLSIYNIQ